MFALYKIIRIYDNQIWTETYNLYFKKPKTVYTIFSFKVKLGGYFLFNHCMKLLYLSFQALINNNPTNWTFFFLHLII